MRKNCSLIEKYLQIYKIFEITKTIYSNSEMSGQFLVTKCFFNLFPDWALKYANFFHGQNILASALKICINRGEKTILGNLKMGSWVFDRPVSPPVDLYLISEKSIWKNQVRRTGFLVYFELDFYCLFVELDFSNLIFQNSSTDQQGVNVLEKG